MNGLAVVVGTAKTFEDDYRQLSELDIPEMDVFCVNRAGFLWPGEKVKYIVSHHYEHLAEFRLLRLSRGFDNNFITVSTHPHPGTDRVVDNMREGLYESGSSALFGVLLALYYNYQKVIVLGVDLSGMYENWRSAWRKAVSLNHRGIHNKARAFSGFPRLILQAPTQAWINS